MLRPMLNVGVLCSNRAPGLDTLLRHALRGTLFDIQCIVSSDPDFGCEGAPVITHAIRKFYDERHAPLRDRGVREEYDAATAEILGRHGVDTLLLIGYLYVVSAPLRNAFGNRILNTHDGLPKYPGLHATRDAIVAGEPATYSIVHVATPDLDAGPLLVLSEPFPVAPFVQHAVTAGYDDIVRAYAYAQREWMMRSAWGAMLVNALERVSSP
jgi:folate-dependent phosphoribosylglycinamide formyltransferase PurN